MRAEIQKNRIVFSSANWHAPPENAREAQVRYRGPRIRGHIEGATFIFDTPLSDPVAPGQSIVFYDGVDCVGGGIIEE
jgi:tRNA U34 2-thiouridine synthase MnmA/TrmU